MAAVLILGWALLRHVPVLAAEPFLSGAWTQAGISWSFAGGALAVAATFPEIAVRSAAISRLVNVGSMGLVAGRICLGLFLVLTGIQHFLFTQFVASLIPAWLPCDAVF